MYKLEKTEMEGKNVILRTDLNLPIEDGEPRKTVRFERYVETIKKLSEKGAKTVVVAHQGRPARNDFLSLEKHAEILSNTIDKEVRFVQSFFGTQLGDAIASMSKGDITMLENIRFLSEELQNVSPKHHSHDYFVENMAKYFDIYVNDAFSAAHRSHGSLVGFTPLLKSIPGPVMEKEIENCGKVRDRFENGLMILGGEKPADIIGILEEMIEDVEKVLLGGIPGELALKIKGKDLGPKSKWIKQKGFESRKKDLEKLLEKHEEKIILPKDVRTEEESHNVDEIPEEMIWDIGKQTQEKYINEINKADQILMKGPMGAFEEGHEKGTKEIVNALAETDAYTVLGGGHTSSLVHRYKHDLKEFSHVSIAGGAFVRFMSGEELAAIKALEENGSL